MGFTSFAFVIFLPATFLIYWLLIDRVAGRSKTATPQNLFLLAASYLFYGWWDWRFLVLIAFTSLCSYGSGLLIERSDSHRAERCWMLANVIVNLLILGIFKYYDFFVSELAALLGIDASRALLHLVLPVGISFYTFQALSYSIDVYRRRIAATHDVVAFAAFLSFFPQLVAGPIERATTLLPQFCQRRPFSCEQALDGMRQMLWGFFKKMVVADTCAIYADQLFATTASPTAIGTLAGALLFTLQIYADFSGYSDIAIGCAKLFGIRLMRNFDNPYFSRSIAEFWRRWHISLTSWFRDYVYIPLGGSRPTVSDTATHQEARRRLLIVRNTLIIFLVSGLWHGANWTYLAWGTYHAILFMPLILTGRNRHYRATVADGRWLPSFREAAQMLGTFLLVAVGWVIFRAEDLAQAWSMLAVLADWHTLSPSLLPFDMQKLTETMLLCLLMLSVEWWTRQRSHALEVLNPRRLRPLRLAGYYMLLLLLLQYGGREQAFIYFQF